MILKNLNLSKKIVAFDTETTGYNPYGSLKKWGFYPARPFVFSFCDADGNTALVRWEVDPFTRQVIINQKSFEEVRAIIENPSITKVAHNLNFDVKMCHFIGLKFKGNFEDTIIASHVITGGSDSHMTGYALKEYCKKTMDYPDDDEKDLEESAKQNRKEAKRKGWCIADDRFGSKPHKADYWLADRDLCHKYAMQDAERTMLLWLGSVEKIKACKNFSRTYDREKRLFFPSLRMELRGVRVKAKKLDELQVFYEQYKNKQLLIANKNGGKNLNFRSSKQKQEIFYEVKRYAPKYFTSKGSPSTDGDSLVYFVEKYNDKLAKSILEHNAADHMISGFITPYKKLKVWEEGCWVLHPNFKQTGTETGRFGCKDPNLMQVADNEAGRKKSEIAFRPREALGPRKDCLWYMPDYSQIEVWGFSFLSGENTMTGPLLSGYDFHTNVAKQVWSQEKDYAEKEKHYRLRAKLVVFCKFYGGGIDKIAYLLGVSRSEASKFVWELDNRFPAISRFIKRMSNKVQADGSIVNPFGRTYYIPSDRAYKAVNYLVQGTCADILKESMIRIDNLFQTKYKGCHMLLTLHDELALEIPKKLHSFKLMREVISAMQQDSKQIGCPIPLPVGMKIVKEDWAHPLEIKSLKEEWKDRYICK